MDTERPLVSIIVPVYKVEKYLGDCVCSIIAQSYKHWELILIDDGSPDNCPRMCDEYAENEERIRVIHKTNGGLPSARNAALDIIKGDYCIFIDSDDFIHQECIVTCVQYSLKYGLDIVEFRSQKSSERVLPNIDLSNIHVDFFDDHSIFTSAMERVMICGKFYKTSLWNGIRMPEGRLNEDDATSWRLYYKANRIAVLDVVFYMYYINDTGICVTQSKTPNINHPILAYSERISYFNESGEKTLETVSKWRFLKYIVLSFKLANLSVEQKKTLIAEYKKYMWEVVACSVVPFKQKVIFVIFPYFNRIARFAYKRKNKKSN